MSSATLVDGVEEIQKQGDRLLASRSDADLEAEIKELEAKVRLLCFYHFVTYGLSSVSWQAVPETQVPSDAASMVEPKTNSPGKSPAKKKLRALTSLEEKEDRQPERWSSQKREDGPCLCIFKLNFESGISHEGTSRCKEPREAAPAAPAEQAAPTPCRFRKDLSAALEEAATPATPSGEVEEAESDTPVGDVSEDECEGGDLGRRHIPDIRDTKAPRPKAGQIHLSKKAIDGRIRRLMTPDVHGNFKVSEAIVKDFHSSTKRKTVEQIFQMCGYDRDCSFSRFAFQMVFL